MTSYAESVVESRKYLPTLTGDTLDAINRLDVLSHSVADAIDSRMEECRIRQSKTKRKVGEIESMRAIAEGLCDKKAHLALLSYDLVDENVRLLDAEIKVLEQAMKVNGDPRLLAAIGCHYTPTSSSASTGDIRRRSPRVLEADGTVDGTGAGGEGEDEYLDHEHGHGGLGGIDPNEPVYCTCRQIAHGDMIACDNDDCALEWFHYACVNLTKLPKSTWLCPDCTYKKKQQGR